jgi:hypothetical protein
LAVVAQPRVKRLLSSEHFSVDGTLIQETASMKSFQPVDQSGEGSGPGEPPPGGRNGAPSPQTFPPKDVGPPKACLLQQPAGALAKHVASYPAVVK